MKKLKNIIAAYQSYILVLALVLSSVAISIRSTDKGVKLVLQDYPVLIFLMIVTSSLLVVVYSQANKRKITTLSNQIKEHAQQESKEADILIQELTDRQREVYDLIIAGKSNKEIASDLFIEQSTLKTHINQIYRKLNIKNRRELKAKISR